MPYCKSMKNNDRDAATRHFARVITAAFFVSMLPVIVTAPIWLPVMLVSDAIKALKK